LTKIRRAVYNNQNYYYYYYYYTRVNDVHMLYKEDPTRLCKSAHGAIVTSIFRNAKINSSSYRVEASADRRHANLAKKNVRSSSNGPLRSVCRPTQLPALFCYFHPLFIRKNSAHFFLIEIITRNVRGFTIVYNLCRAPDSGWRFPLPSTVEYFYPSVANATLRPQTSTGVKWYLHKLRFIRRAESNVETSTRVLGTLNGKMYFAPATRTHVTWQLFY